MPDDSGKRRTRPGKDASAANSVLTTPVVQQARTDVQYALYQMWLQATTIEEREKLHGTALGFEMFYRTLEGYIANEDLRDNTEELQAALKRGGF